MDLVVIREPGRQLSDNFDGRRPTIRVQLIALEGLDEGLRPFSWTLQQAVEEAVTAC
jgi:hypothetical protein